MKLYLVNSSCSRSFLPEVTFVPSVFFSLGVGLTVSTSTVDCLVELVSELIGCVLNGE